MKKNGKPGRKEWRVQSWWFIREQRTKKKKRVVVNASWVWCGEGNEQLVREERGEVERERARGVRTSEREPGLCRRVRKEVRCDAV